MFSPSSLHPLKPRQISVYSRTKAELSKRSTLFPVWIISYSSACKKKKIKKLKKAHSSENSAETEEQGSSFNPRFDNTLKQFTALVIFEKQGDCLKKATAFHAASLLPAQTTLELNSKEPMASRRISVQ